MNLIQMICTDLLIQLNETWLVNFCKPLFYVMSLPFQPLTNVKIAWHQCVPFFYGSVYLPLFWSFFQHWDHPKWSTRVHRMSSQFYARPEFWLGMTDEMAVRMTRYSSLVALVLWHCHEILHAINESGHVVTLNWIIEHI